MDEQRSPVMRWPGSGEGNAIYKEKKKAKKMDEGIYDTTSLRV
jgi:hypothetical protein